VPFGYQDTHLPANEAEKVRDAHPEVEIFWYEAGHGFNCDAQGSYNKEAALEACERTLRFLKKHLSQCPRRFLSVASTTCERREVENQFRRRDSH